MTTPIAVAMALFLAGIAVYAQLEIGRHMGAREATLTRILLVAIGIGSGYVAAVAYPMVPADEFLNFLIGFGAVHFPAAFILLVNRVRIKGKS